MRMNAVDLGADARKMTEEILGYLNFSSGAPDPAFLGNVNRLFGLIENRASDAEPTWRTLAAVFHAELKQLHGRSDAFRRVEQAEAVLSLVFDTTLPEYRRYHGDLLFHQTSERLFRPFFIGRVCEAVLQQGGPWDQSERIARGAIDRLNDYLGHRPVPVLETEQKIQPYAHECVRPVPLFIRGAGVAVGRYRELIRRALAILEATDTTLLFQACFDPALLDELALDPRAYDFDHPVNKRPNYLFGQWDMNCLDNSGRSRRFVLQEVSLEAMLARVEDRGKLPYEEAMFEAAAVLAGTMLMGSGVSGDGPEAHDSDTTLATLVGHIAAYRDAFYEQLLSGLSGPHAERLQAEATTLRQPLGGARQDFNQRLARRRAQQLQHVHLALLFARMGYLEAGRQQVRVVPVASARMQCDIYCRLATAYLEAEQGRLEQAAAILPEIEDLLHRAIECGALVDPWNILGFAAQYNLFPAVENSVHDHRTDELIDLVGEIFDLYVQIQKEAASAGNTKLQQTLSAGLGKLAQWWDKFASLEVGAVEGISGRETRESADHVAAALRARREAGAAAGDVGFWRGHVEQFRSPKAYALVVEALIDQRDLVAAMALLVQWLSRAEQVPLVEESFAFHDLVLRWMEDLWQPQQPAGEQPVTRCVPPGQCWPLARKFLDYLEANAGEYGEVPRFELADQTPDGAEMEEDQADDLFSAAYEGVTYRDSTDDGFEGEMLEGGENATDFELVAEAQQIVNRLAFLTVLARLWKLSAVASAPGEPPGRGEQQRAGSDRDDVLAGWLDRAMTNRRHLLELLAALHRYRIPPPRGTHESLVEYDRRRGIKEMLTEQVITTCVETADAARMIRVAMHRHDASTDLDDWEEPVERVLRGVLRGDVAGVRNNWRELLDALRRQPLLYVDLARGGNPRRIVASRSIQYTLRRLLAYLPRLGLLRETRWLLETIEDMERDHPVGQGAITEFDQMFQIGCKAVVRCLVVSSEDWHIGEPDSTARVPGLDLIGCLEQATESLLRCWLAHSRGVRLSVLETIDSERRWRDLKRFIRQYGGNLFTQKFMSMGNLRAILHQGVDAWLESLLENSDTEEEFRFLAELDGPLKRNHAVRHLSVAMEAVVENYPEYIDYNSTTTQSDRGELLYTLLDFLRLRTAYDRVAWNLRPVVLTHDVMLRCGHHQAAEIWREAVAQRTGDIAEEHLKRLARLNRKYGMRLSSIADRLGERFVRPLAIDRLRALVRPAIKQLSDGLESEAFRRLEAGIAEFTEELSGAGFDVPAWLEALEDEVDQVNAGTNDEDQALDSHLHIPQVRLSIEEVEQEVKAE